MVRVTSPCTRGSSSSPRSGAARTARRRRASFFRLTLCLIATLSLRPVAAHAQEDAATADFTPLKSSFLSSEHPRGTLRIRNDSRETLTFYRLGVSDEDSRVTGGLPVHELRSFSGPRRSDTVAIAPQATYEGSVSLTPCTLLAKPCSVAAVLSVALRRPNGDYLRLKTPSHSYEVVADPTATFVDPGLRSNRPLIVTQGESYDTLYPDVFVIAIHPSASEPPPASSAPGLTEAAAAIASRAGVLLEGSGTSSDAQGWYAMIEVPGASAQRERIAKVLDEIKRELAPRVRSITHYFTIEPWALDPAFERATLAGEVAARRFADVLGVGPLLSSRLNGDDLYAVGTASFTSFDLNQLNGLRFDQAPLKATPVRAREVVVRAGSRPVATGFSLEETSQAEYDGQAVKSAEWPQVDATIEADRPELYVVAGADEGAALAAGRDPGALAFAYARARAGVFASLLGARLGVVSMVVLPTVAGHLSGTRIRPLGLAMTMDSPDGVSSTAGSSDVPTGLPSTPPSTPAPFVPISVADRKSTITTTARVDLTAAAQDLRVNVTVEPSSDAPDPSSVEAELRKNPLVSDIALQGATGPEAPVVYRVVLRSTDAGDRARLVESIHRLYGSTARTLNAVDALLIRDCRSLERRALATAIDQARARAAARADADRVRLARLLLAGEYPFGADNDACYDRADAPALGSRTVYASAASGLHVWGGVSLTFRTEPIR